MSSRGTLSDDDRQAYTKAVLCLQSKPAASLKTLVPGARSRFDDFHAVHINQTFIIHNNVSRLSVRRGWIRTAYTEQAQFLPWHRYFTWAYEKALRDECDYEGYQPSAIPTLTSNRPLADPCPYQILGLAQIRPRSRQLPPT